MNELEAPLHEVVERVSGARVAALIGMDGMIVSRAGDADAVPLDLFVATYADLVRRADRSATECGLSSTQEMIVGTEAGTMVLRVVTGEYGVLAVLAPGGSLGRARYELQRTAYGLRDSLER